MESQGKRVLGVLGMDVGLVESMVQDRIPEQDTPEQDMNEQEQVLPQPNPEPEMGAAAAAAYDTSPSLLRNPPPIPAETAHPSAPDMAQLFAMMAELNRNMNANMQTLRGEMQRIGRGLQAGTAEIMAIARSEVRTRKWRRHVLGRTSLGGVQRLSGPRWRRVRTG